MAEKILVVEDETILRETLAYNFAKEGFTVEQAADGPAANEGCPFGTRCAMSVDEEDGESQGVVRLH